ncbi:carboxypeptidase PM20D1 [Eubacterium aggregans]|uniref:Carboxypeptidase PM20D1 n=2 Tax=Eubacterium aggregans TaxID=81409 RepID=A0A1H4CG80_9FIRM|nr:carboxypeptidase PM20D1 [Eubacterium aggregans]
MLIGWIILGAILVFLGVLLIRTAAFVPPVVEKPADVDLPAMDEEKISRDMADIIRCRTISYRDDDQVNWDEYQRLYGLIEERFPLVHKNGHREFIGKTGLLFTWKGKHSDAPAVYMAHYDVVPVDAEAWERPPFEGVIEDGVLWGRGTLDTKGTFCSILEAAEILMAQGFVPDQDIYLAFSGEEEIDGLTAVALSDTLKDRGVHPAIVLDEGGAVVENVLPGVTVPCALIGTAEKGKVNVELQLKGVPGHASTPPRHTAVGRLAKAAVAIEAHPFAPRLISPVAEMFDCLGRHSSFAYRMLFANLWCFKPVLYAMAKKGGTELSAMMMTTVALTRMSGSDAFNVMPPEASMGGDIRILPGENAQSVEAHLRSVIGDDDITIHRVNGTDPKPVSPMAGPGWERLTRVIGQTWPEAVVSPYLMLACSDARHYCRVFDKVYRFSAMALSKEERGMIHGHNERIPLSKLYTTVAFYLRMMMASN